MPNTEDWYEILQVHPTDEPEVILTAYRRLARKYHPDVSKSDQTTKMMTVLNLAYEVLGDPDKRAAYDLERGSQKGDTTKEPPGQSQAWNESKPKSGVSHIPYEEGRRQLFQAARSGDTEKIRSLIYSGVSVKSHESNKGWTPLHVVASMGHLKTAQFLVSVVSVNIRDYNRYTPLHVAAEAGNLSIVQMLATLGADINAKSMDGFTPLHVAAEAGNLSIVQMLAAFGADINAEDKVGFTPLHVAAKSGNLSIVQMLAAHGADINAKTRKVSTPLYVAARDGNTEVVRELIKLGADVNAMIGIKTPLDVALTEGHDSTASVLRAAGAKTIWQMIRGDR